MRGLSIGLLGLLLVPITYGLDAHKALQDYRQRFWNLKDGLPAGFVYSVTQTTDGYIWLGTADGLARFDGLRFDHWQSTNSHKLLLGAVRVVAADDSGGLWAGTASGKLVHVHGAASDITNVGAQVESVLDGGNRGIWVATSRQVLHKAAGSNEGFKVVCNLPGDPNSPLLQDGRGAVWFSTRTTVERVDPSSLKVNTWPVTHGSIWLTRNASGDIFLTRSDGVTSDASSLSRLLNSSLTAPAIPGMRTVFRDREGLTWIGTGNGDVVRIKPGREEPVPVQLTQSEALSNKPVRALFEDRELNIWAATQDGLYCLSDVNIAPAHDEALSSNKALQALSDDPADYSTIHERGLSVKRVFRDSSDRDWVATDRGVIRIQNERSHFLFSPQLTSITAIGEDRHDAIWIADAAGGLFRWSESGTSDFSAEPVLRGKSISAVGAGADGRVWFGTYSGTVIDYDGRQFNEMRESDGLPRGMINNISAENDGTVWIASEGGLTRLQGTTLRTWNSNHGLPGDRVVWVLPDRDGQRLWLGYTTLLAVVNRGDLDRSLEARAGPIPYRYFDSDDGLRGNLSGGSTPVIQTADNKIWFKTSAGTSVIDPDHLVRNTVPPLVQIEQITADDRVTKSGNRLSLPPLTHRLQINYTGLSFIAPQRVLFRYKLEGYDSTWQDVGSHRQAVYTDLPPRNYRFRVIASNNDGIWNEAGSSLEFELLPAFYQTIWFRLVCLVAALVLAWGLYCIRMRHLATQLRGRFEERLNERTRIAQELHDNLLQNLLAVSLQLEVTDEMLPASLPAKKPLAKALGLSKTAMNQGRQALKDLRTAPLSVADLVDGFSQAADLLRSGGDAPEISVLVEGNPRPLNSIAGNDFLQIGRQAIANAAQHAEAANIYVVLNYGGRDLRLSVQDDGCGIDKDILTHGRQGHHGMRGMSERAERLHANFSVRSSAGHGTEINLSVPVEFVYQKDPDSSPGSISRWRRAWTSLGSRLFLHDHRS